MRGALLVQACCHGLLHRRRLRRAKRAAAALQAMARAMPARRLRRRGVSAAVAIQAAARRRSLRDEFLFMRWNVRKLQVSPL